jgi:uncharacterized membrane protein
MNWKHRNSISGYLQSSLWIIPIGALILEEIATPFVRLLDARLAWGGASLGIEGARALCTAVVNLTLSFTVFTFGSLLIAIQVASGQYTPRIIATTLLRNNVIRYTVALFVFAFIFSIRALNRIETSVPQLTVFITGLLGLMCITAFLFLIDYAARLLRPVSLVRSVGEAGLKVIEHVYPSDFVSGENNNLPNPRLRDGERTVIHHRTSGVVVKVDIEHLLSEAEKMNGIIELVPQVGDFVSNSEPLFRLHDGAAAISDQVIEGSVLFGSERTLEQDPLFAFRILVDIAIKALSPAINDPTTGVLAIDQLHRLLRKTGRRNLRTDYILNWAGKVRVVLRTPNWEDFVHLALTEIRFYGAPNIQIARRIRAMINNLTNTLPSERHQALRRELDLLDRTLEKLYLLPEDLSLARIPDTQGLGASTNILAAG